MTTPHSARTARTYLWRGLDPEGFERAVVQQTGGGGWLLSGTALLSAPEPAKLQYRVECDGAWHTLAVEVQLEDGGAGRELRLTCGGAGRWQLDGSAIDLGSDCLDVDISASPMTNTLPLRRLGLQVGETASVAVAWVLFPGLEVERSEQTYERLSQTTYRFRTGSFVADLEVDEYGVVTRYHGLWQLVSSS